jgi:hypothetical protein
MRLTCMFTERAVKFLFVLAVPLAVYGANKPRVFVADSQPIRISRSGVVSSAGTVEVMKNFAALCPEIVVTSSRDRASYEVRVDYDPVGPATPFYRGNKVAVFNKDEDLIYSGSTRLLKPSVKGACAAILAAERK